jgi:hypothetical protein
VADFTENNLRTFTAGGAVAIYVRVITPSAIATAGALDVDIGTLELATATLGDDAVVRLRSAAGTVRMVAAAAIAKDARVYGAAAGKITSTINTNPVGVALEAANASGNVIEVLRMPLPQTAFGLGEDHTADDTLTVAESGSLHTNAGEDGAMTLALPAATVGLHYYFYVIAVQELRIDPDGTETIALPSTGVQGAAGKYLTANAAGEHCHLFCQTAGEWEAVSFEGVWTAEG